MAFEFGQRVGAKRESFGSGEGEGEARGVALWMLQDICWGHTLSCFGGGGDTGGVLSYIPSRRQTTGRSPPVPVGPARPVDDVMKVSLIFLRSEGVVS